MNIEPSTLVAWGTAIGSLIAALIAIFAKRSESKSEREKASSASQNQIAILRAEGEVKALNERVSVESELARQQSQLVNQMITNFQGDIDKMRHELEIANLRLTEAHMRENECASRIINLTQQHERAITDLLVVRADNAKLQGELATVKQQLEGHAERINETEEKVNGVKKQTDKLLLRTGELELPK